MVILAQFANQGKERVARGGPEAVGGEDGSREYPRCDGDKIPRKLL